MATDVVMPQMGESIAEGTVVRWIKKVGVKVAGDEPLFEISTDKVDAEIPSPVAGVVAEIRVKEGETVPVNSVVAVIGQAGDVAAPPAVAASAPPQRASAPQAPPVERSEPRTDRPHPQPAARVPGPPDAGERTRAAPSPPALEDQKQTAATSTAELLRQRSSPLVRR